MTDWIEWNGGECPVKPTSEVKVRYRPMFKDEVAEYGPNTAGNLEWVHKFALNGDPSWGDIVAYRVVS